MEASWILTDYGCDPSRNVLKIAYPWMSRFICPPPTRLSRDRVSETTYDRSWCVRAGQGIGDGLQAYNAYDRDARRPGQYRSTMDGYVSAAVRSGGLVVIVVDLVGRGRSCRSRRIRSRYVSSGL